MPVLCAVSRGGQASPVHGDLQLGFADVVFAAVQQDVSLGERSGYVSCAGESGAGHTAGHVVLHVERVDMHVHTFIQAHGLSTSSHANRKGHGYFLLHGPVNGQEWREGKDSGHQTTRWEPSFHLQLSC